MASNYQESPIAGTEWRRAFRVQIENPYQGTPAVVFYEQRAISLASGEVITIPADPSFLEVVFDPSAEIPLVNPWTGDPMTDVNGNPQFATHIEAYILLHSLYIQNAKIRDTPPSNVDPGPSEPPPSP